VFRRLGFRTHGETEGAVFLGASETVDDGNAKSGIVDKKMRLYERERGLPGVCLPSMTVEQPNAS